jgi:hypothetical protein
VDLLGITICDHIVGDPIEKFTLENCPKCNGKGVVGDISFDSNGKVNTVGGIELLKQKIKKILTESTRDTGYGFNYNMLSYNDKLKSGVKSEIYRCINYLINLQKEKEKEGFYYLPTEKIDSIDKVDILENPDPRKVEILIVCKSTSGKQAEINLSLEV